jgi:hypothetical protein
LEKISPESLLCLSEFLSIEPLKDLEFTAVFQPTLSNDKIPDGLLISEAIVICFENKVDQSHTSQQLREYYTQLKIDNLDQRIMLLISADSNNQSPIVLRKIVKEAEIPSEDAIVISWQWFYLYCEAFPEEIQKYTKTPNDVDLFLHEEFKLLLESMEMIPYTGLEANDLKGFKKTLIQLSEVESQLIQEIPKLIPEVEPFDGRSSYSSFFKEFLGFPLKTASGTGADRDSYLYVDLMAEEGLEIGLCMNSKTDIEKFLEKCDMKSLGKTIEKLKEYHLTCGHNQEWEVPSSEVADFLLKESQSVGRYFDVSREISFENLEQKFGLNTVDFPNLLTEEIVRMRELVLIIADLLQ